MNATNAMFHLDAVARSVPEPVFPPDTLDVQIPAILRATRPFLDTDRDWMISNVTDLQRQVSVYDALLNRIDEIRSEVQSRRDAVHKVMVVYSSTLAPVRRLPADVLRTVFRKIQVSQWRNTTQTELAFSQGPWTLSHVCGAWRDVVLSYPQLWSHIVLRPYHVVGLTFRHTLVALKAMILRSEQCPLDIVFKFDDEYNKDMPAEEAFSVILEASHRWRTLLLNSCLEFLERLKGVRGRIPRLESLTLNLSNIPERSRAELPEDIRSSFADAPRLQKIILRGTHGLGDFVFPLHITHLAACVENVSNLGVYQSLVECHLEIHIPSSNLDISLPLHIFLPNVRCLFVSSLRILAHLCLPSLSDLAITRGEDTESIRQYAPIVNDFLHRSRCTLTRFASPNGGNDILRQASPLLMDTVVCLEGVFYSQDEDILNALASDGFLPNLQHLRLSGSVKILTAMITSCRRHLRSVIIYSHAHKLERVNQQLAQMQGPGQHFIAALEGQGCSRYGNFNRSDLDVAVDR
ncbi:hypothetical protein EV421DRAFT_1769184 [Armillaria borealis]|uniref:F-box domain-containing protein n=1 Tax=Armillaria borealis TaxID=47425 RepID=A0AA39K0W3_9AGAR|nr:hypothetical protein EV421DRAFT_1769184 [Armillaria borealis]